MPLKVAVLGLGQVDELAKLAGAGNTLVLEGGERWVYNTDVGGLIWAVGQVTATPLPRVTILGAGATARAALIAATQLGAQAGSPWSRVRRPEPNAPCTEPRVGRALEISPGQRRFQTPTLSFRPSSPERPTASRRPWRTAPR